MTILNNNSPIGFFDSGVGGLTVLKEVKKLLPNEDFIFYGDNIHVPYGDKSKEQLLEYSQNILNFFEKQNCKAVVMACNTTSSTIYDDIKNSYNFKLYPVVQSVAKILAQYNIERLGVFATKATIKSNAYPNEISKYNQNIKVFGQYCSKWVNIVESNLIHNIESITTIKSDLDKMMLNHPQKIVLGCTHYPYLLPILSKFEDENIFIDPAIYFAQYIKKDLEKSNILKNNNTPHKEDFYVSKNPQQFKSAAKMFYNIKNEVKLLTF